MFLTSETYSKKRGEDIFNFAYRVSEAVCAAASAKDVDMVVFERQFDKAPDKPLEFVQHATEFGLFLIPHVEDRMGEVSWGVRLPLAIEYSPTQLKKYVTGRGNADEAEYWRKIERKCASGVFPFAELENQHVIEAGIYAIMGLDWLKIYYEGDEEWRCHGNREAIKKPRILWNVGAKS